MYKFKIIYHKNCMDGLASAFIAKTTLERTGEVQCIALQYGEEQVLFGRDDKIGLTHPITKDDIVYFVDFSLKRELMIELSSKVKEIVVLDHHKTAEENLRGLEDELENVTIIFDMNKSGATLCFDYFADSGLQFREIFDYIADRDLWNWKMGLSKEVNEYIRFSVKPNDLESFEKAYKDFYFGSFAQYGAILLKQKEIQVASKVKKVKDTIINGIAFKMLNATENISEIGNEICKIYNTPALIYFFTENDEVVCSLRSIDTLEDVSVVAKAFGGGGHRNACGFTLSINDFYILQTDPRFINKNTIQKTVEEEYERFLKDIVEVDGELDKEQVKKELYDFGQIIHDVQLVYCHVTNGRISKPLTKPEVVMRVADECNEREIEDRGAELLECQQDKSFENIAKDMIKYLNDNHHPHTRVIVDSSSCEVVEGLKCFHTTEYIKD